MHLAHSTAHSTAATRTATSSEMMLRAAADTAYKGARQVADLTNTFFPCTIVNSKANAPQLSRKTLLAAAETA